MDLAARKYKFIEQLMKIASAEKLDKLEKFFKKEIDISPDPYDELPRPIKRLLAQSKKDSGQGRSKSHEEVMADIRAKYNLS